MLLTTAIEPNSDGLELEKHAEGLALSNFFTRKLLFFQFVSNDDDDDDDDDNDSRYRLKKTLKKVAKEEIRAKNRRRDTDKDGIPDHLDDDDDHDVIPDHLDDDDDGDGIPDTEDEDHEDYEGSGHNKKEASGSSSNATRMHNDS